MDAIQEEQVRQAVAQALDGYYGAARQCDPHGFLSFFVDAEDMSVIENDEIRPSRKVFEEWVHGFFAGVTRLDVTAEEGRVFPLAPDVAVAAGVFRFSARLNSGDTVGGRNAFTFVFVKRGERWQVKHVHESSLPVEA